MYMYNAGCCTYGSTRDCVDQVWSQYVQAIATLSIILHFLPPSLSSLLLQAVVNLPNGSPGSARDVRYGQAEELLLQNGNSNCTD